MFNFENMTVRQKLAVPLSFVALLILVVSFISISNSRSLAHNTETLSATFTESISTALNADRDLYQAHSALLDLMLAEELEISGAASLIEDYEENAQQANDRMAKVLSLTKDYPDVVSQAKQFRRDFDNWIQLNQQVMMLIGQKNVGQAAAIYHQQGMPLFEALRGNYDRIGEAVKNQSDKITRDSLAASNQQTVYLIIAVVLAVVACAVSIIIGPRLITRRINMLRDVLDSISKGEGDLTQRLSTHGRDEITGVALAFNALMDNLQRLIKLIKADAVSLKDAETSMRSSSDDVRHISHEQRDNLDQIATAINELSYALKEVADNTQDALSDTRTANEDAADSQAAVSTSAATVSKTSQAITHASSVIQKLEKETQHISSLLDVISGISEQTNLLALNAAIEAARAGEQGRGFAVVADEVRSLANRSQQATTDINEMLLNLNKGVSEAVSAIESGSSQMAEVVEISASLNEKLNKVSSSVTGANDRIYQIATATEEQSQVVMNLNETVSALNTLSQQVIATVEQAGAASQRVSDVSRNIDGNVNRFKV